jgi:biopolymer transport protein TolR
MPLLLKRPSSRLGSRRKAMSDINVTPFVDVMLVLLIVFMITAPMLTPALSVDLPKTKTGALSDTQNQPLTVTIDKDGKIYIGGERVPVKPAELAPKLQAIAGENLERRVFIRGDQGASYGRVVGVVALLQGAGFTQAALVTDNNAGDAILKGD